MPEGQGNASFSSVLSLILGAVGLLLTATLAVFPEHPNHIVLISLFAISILSLGYVPARILLRRIPQEEQRRNQAFLAAVTDSQSVSSSARRTASACYAMEVSQTEAFLTELLDVQGRMQEFADEAERAYEDGKKGVSDLQKMVDTLLDDCKFLHAHHWVFRFLTRDFCARHERWSVIRQSFLEFIGVFERQLAFAMRQVPKKIRVRSRGGTESLPAEKKEQLEERRKLACQQTATAARLLLAEPLAALIESVEIIRDLSRMDLRGAL